ncbi:MAG: bifunctional phosphopantothenoylcysteine decarboxylase/phosphopantothenate--cysteine ligase CoaBC [Gammaproteobacteria bacterium]
MGVCGGIAAYKSAELVRLLRKQNVEVRVAMTASAMRFVAPLTFQALSGNPVHTDLLDPAQENAMGHINLARWADLLLVAPATANMIAKMSQGLADDLLSALYLAAQCPVAIAPAMNQAMWLNAATVENIRRLEKRGVAVIGPDEGGQACGEYGPGRMTEPSVIVERLMAVRESGALKGKKVLISAGPTREPIDPVRYITNRSSGKMGYALVEAALKAGAEVYLVSGPVALEPPQGASFSSVETAAQMYEAVLARAKVCDIFIGAAAVADYAPANASPSKIKKSQNEMTLALSKTKDILAAVAGLSGRPFTVGFAAETDEIETYALDKLAEKNLDMIAANRVGQPEGGFDSDVNALSVFWNGGRRDFSMTGKKKLAEQLIELIAEKYDEKNSA